MALSKTRWRPFAESRFPHEREALEFLGQSLPDSDPNLLYTNFEFIADDGSVNEVDALVITRAGVFLVEIKGRSGVVLGNRHNWDWEKDGHTLSIDSPLILANAKARKLADLIGKQRSFRNERRPWIEPLVFLSAPGISVRLPEAERMRICEREPRDKAPGIIPALLQRDYLGSIPAHGAVIDRPTAKRVAQALDDAGIRQPMIRRLAEKTWTASRKESRIARTVVLKLKTAEFHVLTRSQTPSAPPASCEELTEIALSLRGRVNLSPTQRFRLIGVGLGNFQNPEEVAEPSLFSHQPIP